MALPTLADAKWYVGKETNEADASITALLAVALGVVEGIVGTPITARERVMTAIYESYNSETGASVLHLPGYPVQAVPVVVVDADDDAVAPADYALDLAAGRIVANAATGKAWSNGPYSVTAFVGLSAHPEYATAVEPRLYAAILLAFADLYHNRNPRASSESAAGAGVGLTADAERRVRAVLGDVAPRARVRVA